MEFQHRIVNQNQRSGQSQSVVILYKRYLKPIDMPPIHRQIKQVLKPKP